MSNRHTLKTSYGKLRIPVYRVYATPLRDVKAIPESQFKQRENILLACEIDVEVFGENFLPAYTHGDNTNVVATDSMKNFILRQALDFEGATLEEFLHNLGQRFIETYPQMERISLSAREIPFTAVTVPQTEQGTFRESNVLFQRSHNDFTFVTLEYERDSANASYPILISHRCGRIGMELLKVTGSAFSRFIRDEYTTLEERVDRPLFIFLNVYWRYDSDQGWLESQHEGYVAAEQIRDLIQVVFDRFVSESIQHLVHEMGKQILERFPQLSEVTFEGQNRTRDLIVTSDRDEKIKVYSDPFSAYGIIKLTMSRNV